MCADHFLTGDTYPDIWFLATPGVAYCKRMAGKGRQPEFNALPNGKPQCAVRTVHVTQAMLVEVPRVCGRTYVLAHGHRHEDHLGRR